MTLRVLHIGKFFPPHLGGMETFLAELIEAQRAQGIDAYALVHGTPLPGDPSWLVRVPVQFNLIYAPIAFGFRQALGRAIRQFRPDMLHLHLPNNSALWALTLPAARKVPCVVHWHSDVVVSSIKLSVALAYILYKPFENAVLDRAQLIVATSPPYLEASSALKPWRSKCVVIPLGAKLDYTSTLPDASAIVRWQEKTKLRLLSIGRLTYYKGFETLILAVQKLPGVELLIAGEGELRPALETLIGETTPQGQKSRVKLLGAVKEAEKHNLLRDCDVFCLASRERTEAFGIVLLEAMMHRKPCIVTDLPGSGMPWVVAHADAGLRVPLEDVTSWCNAILSLRDDARLRRQFGESGYHTLNQLFDIKCCERALARQYRFIESTSICRAINRKLLVIVHGCQNAEKTEKIIKNLIRQINADVIAIGKEKDSELHKYSKSKIKTINPSLPTTAWGCQQIGLRFAYTKGYEKAVSVKIHSITSSINLRDLFKHVEGDLVLISAKNDNNLFQAVGSACVNLFFGIRLKSPFSNIQFYNRRAMKAAISPEAILYNKQGINFLSLMIRHDVKIREIQVEGIKPYRFKIPDIAQFILDTIFSALRYKATAPSRKK